MIRPCWSVRSWIWLVPIFRSIMLCVILDFDRCCPRFTLRGLVARKDDSIPGSHAEANAWEVGGSASDAKDGRSSTLTFTYSPTFRSLHHVTLLDCSSAPPVIIYVAYTSDSFLLFKSLLSCNSRIYSDNRILVSILVFMYILCHNAFV